MDGVVRLATVMLTYIHTHIHTMKRSLFPPVFYAMIWGVGCFFVFPLLRLLSTIGYRLSLMRSTLSLSLSLKLYVYCYWLSRDAPRAGLIDSALELSSTEEGFPPPLAQLWILYLTLGPRLVPRFCKVYSSTSGRPKAP